MEIVYGEAARKAKLTAFIAGLAALIAHVDFCKEFPGQTQDYQSLLEHAKSIFESRYEPEELSELSFNFTPTFWTDREWCPPLKSQDNEWIIPQWFSSLDKLHKRVVDAAFQLRCSGESLG